MTALPIDSAQGVLTLVLSGSAVIGLAVRYVVRPLHQLVDMLADVPEYNGRIKRLETEVLANGDDRRLPEELRGKPLRSLVIDRAVQQDKQFKEIARQQEMALQLLMAAAEE